MLWVLVGIAYVVDAPENSFDEAVLMSTHEIHFLWKMRLNIFQPSMHLNCPSDLAPSCTVASLI